MSLALLCHLLFWPGTYTISAAVFIVSTQSITWREQWSDLFDRRFYFTGFSLTEGLTCSVFNRLAFGCTHKTCHQFNPVHCISNGLMKSPYQRDPYYYLYDVDIFKCLKKVIQYMKLSPVESLSQPYPVSIIIICWRISNIFFFSLVRCRAASAVGYILSYFCLQYWSAGQLTVVGASFL